MATTPFVRDHFTWLAYLMLAYYAYLQTVLGPAMPFLRAELKLSYTQAGLHFSAFALGMIGAGLSGDRLARRRGRAWTFWGGAAGMGVGAALLALARQPALTIGSALMMGFFGSLLRSTIQAGLSDRHGDRRAIAMTESNIAASVLATLAPLSVGGWQQAGAGWRGALWLILGLVVLLALVTRREPVPEAPAALRGPGTRPLSVLFWAYWLVIALCVAAEWCLAYWGADFLESTAGLARSAASTTMSLFFVAMIVGRVAGSRLARRRSSAGLLLAALGVAAAGFPLFWLGRHPALNVAGLFVTGLGVANLFPLAMTVASDVAAQQADAAGARVTMAAGLAILSAPLLLGGLADRAGIQLAYGLVPLLLGAAGAVTFWARRMSKRAADASE